MSDRYRPPTGPKGPRGPSSSKNWSGSNPKQQHQYRTPLPNRYDERDNYRPKLIEKEKQSNGFIPSSGQDKARPSGPSAYRDSPRGNQKRVYPESRPSKYVGAPNKRRDFVPKEGPGSSREDERWSDVPLNRTPKGSRVFPPERKPKDKKPTVPPVVNKKPPMPRLRPDQIYSVYSLRPSDLYKRVQQVGEGTYGKVYKAKNEVTDEDVAIKRLRLETEREGFPITAMREIKLLQSFDHPNIVGLLEMMVEHNQIIMIFDYLNHDLTGLLTLPDLRLTEGHRKMIFKQLLDGLNYLHKRRVIHRDIKGSNILLNSKGILKIADFGLARNMKVLREGESPDYTNRVITIWYRPPELLMGSTDYGREVDVWGVGCLLIELYTKSAIFQGTEEISQLFKIYEIMGTPTAENWPDIENLPWFEMLKPKVNRVSKFRQEYRELMTEDSFDLAEKMLTYQPSKRITAEEALRHSYFHTDPKPEELTFMQDIIGEWHEFETKKRRREERKRLHDLKSAKGRETTAVTASTKVDSPPALPKSVSQTPFEKAESEFADSLKQEDEEEGKGEEKDDDNDDKEVNGLEAEQKEQSPMELHELKREAEMESAEDGT